MISLFAADPPPAGGTPIGEVLAAGAVGAIAIAIVVAIGVAHRRKGLLTPLATAIERRFGLPAWAAIPVVIAGVSLVVAVWGYYWDVSWHIDRGRDPGAFANPAHWFIILGLDGIAFAGILSLFLGDDRSPSAVRLTDRWSVPAGSVMLMACGVVALAGFPLDDIWHRLFGQDVTAWGPTHIQMIGGASLATLGCWALLVEGRRAAGALPRHTERMIRAGDIALAGAFLIGLSTLQVEFDFGVPQFRLLEHPVLLALGASIGLVAARLRVGRGGAIAAALFFIVLRGALAIGIGSLGRTIPHFPLYIVEALLVEAVALRVSRDRQLTFGAIAGLAIGTVGFAGEWLWSRVWMPIGWSGDLLPEAIPLVAMAGVAGGLLGGLAGRAVSVDVERQPTRRGLAPVAWLGAVAAIGIALPMGAHENWTAELTLAPAPAADGQDQAFVTVELDPPDAAVDAAWFHILSWQGADQTSDGGSKLVELVRQPDGSYTSAEPVPVSGIAKTLVRLHTGDSLQAVPVYLPEDAAIPADEVPAEDGARAFVREKLILQREARTDNVGLERTAYVLLAGLAALWMVILSWGLARIERPPTRKPPRRATTRRRPAPHLRPRLTSTSRYRIGGCAMTAR